MFAIIFALYSQKAVKQTIQYEICAYRDTCLYLHLSVNWPWLTGQANPGNL